MPLPTVIVKTQVRDYASIVNLEVDGRRRHFRGIDCLLQSGEREWLAVHCKYFHPRAETCLIGNFAHQDIRDHAVRSNAHGKGIPKVVVSAFCVDKLVAGSCDALKRSFGQGVKASAEEVCPVVRNYLIQASYDVVEGVRKNFGAGISTETIEESRKVVK
jgi:hypothetical protein